MKDLFTMWKHTRMVVLVALTAAVYAAVLIPLKVAIPIIPGFTEVRPANVIPIICSLMFGPAAAWGSAFGNLAGDIYGGTFGPGSAFGFVGNFLYGYVPYKVWRWLAHRVAVGAPVMNAGRQMVAYVGAVILASGACAFVIAWGVNLLGLVPFRVIGPIIFTNNAAVSLVLGPPLLRILYPRVRRWGLLYEDVMGDGDISRGRLATVGLLLLVLTAMPGIIAGFVIGTQFSESSVNSAMAPVVAAMLLGCALL
ncbi:MAG: QueT transporter family protein [Armatimonadota bacterium]|nr:MAG: QueT transporter family protein [Armatimonadota bacterium]